MARALAQSVVDELLASFRAKGIFECVNGNYRQLEHYVIVAVFDEEHPGGRARVVGGHGGAPPPGGSRGIWWCRSQ